MVTEGEVMAIIACKECGKEVSDKAAVCPHCGAKPRKGVVPLVKIDFSSG
jgi:DNA-directed RNA polymerase subunit RPC12/RpoP